MRQVRINRSGVRNNRGRNLLTATPDIISVESAWEGEVTDYHGIKAELLRAESA